MGTINPTERTRVRVSAEIPQELLRRLRKYVVDSRNSLHAQSAVICELLERGLKEKGY
jgi:ornithine cyclodeaminase/alanine dehydrogenase-like protein (mu-crystallin family)